MAQRGRSEGGCPGPGHDGRRKDEVILQFTGQRSDDLDAVDGNQLLDLLQANLGLTACNQSSNGGATFQPNIRVSAGTSNAASAEKTGDLNDYGGYSGQVLPMEPWSCPSTAVRIAFSTACASMGLRRWPAAFDVLMRSRVMASS